MRSSFGCERAFGSSDDRQVDLTGHECPSISFARTGVAGSPGVIMAVETGATTVPNSCAIAYFLRRQQVRPGIVFGPVSNKSCRDDAGAVEGPQIGSGRPPRHWKTPSSARTFPVVHRTSSCEGIRPSPSTKSLEELGTYSARSATTGSTREARCAGIILAPTATAARMALTDTHRTGSVIDRSARPSGGM